MSELFAEKRMDRRGFLVTRHVRRDTSASSKSLGKAALSPLFGKDERFPGNFKERVKSRMDRLPKAERKAMMATLNPDTFPALHALGLGQSTSGNTSDSAILIAMDTCFEERSFSLLNNIAILAHEGDEPYPFELVHQLVPSVKGLSQYQSEEDTERNDYSTASDEEVANARVLLFAYNKMQSAFFNTCAEHDYNIVTGEGAGGYFSNPRMVEAITSDHERVPNMIKLIREQQFPFKTDEDIENLCEMADSYGETMTVLHDGLL